MKNHKKSKATAFTLRETTKFKDNVHKCLLNRQKMLALEVLFCNAWEKVAVDRQKFSEDETTE